MLDFSQVKVEKSPITQMWFVGYPMNYLSYTGEHVLTPFDSEGRDRIYFHTKHQAEKHLEKYKPVLTFSDLKVGDLFKSVDDPSRYDVTNTYVKTSMLNTQNCLTLTGSFKGNMNTADLKEKVERVEL